MHTSTKLLDTMLRHSIGLDPLFFQRNATEANYPPHNIAQLADDQYRLTMAVAGFGEDDLDITAHNDLLTITGKRLARTPEDERVLYSGIAFRDFVRQFKIGEYVYVDAATLKDGLLEITLARRLPEAMKPKKIDISPPNRPTLLKQVAQQAA